MGFAAAIGFSALVAMASYGLPRLSRPWRSAGLAAAFAALAASLFLVPAASPVLRFVAGVVAALLTGKVLDYVLAGPAPGTSEAGFAAYLRHLTHPGALDFPASQRRLAPDRSRAPDARQLARAVAALAAGLLAAYTLIAGRVAASSFPADHVLKALTFLLVVEGFAQAVSAGARLAGLDAVPLVDLALLARTPADFWRRYNRQVGTWLHRYAFLPSGGTERPVLATLVAFGVSGLLHEYLFAVATGQVRGYQMIFFLLQGAGVLASHPLARLARRYGSFGSGAAWLATLGFMLATSVFFFASFARVWPPFYSATPLLP